MIDLCRTYTASIAHGVIVAIDDHLATVKWIDYRGPQHETYMLGPVPAVDEADTVPARAPPAVKARPFGSTAMPRNRFCGSYGPSHLMHWIQGKKSLEDGQPIIKVKAVAVHDDGRVEIEGDDLKLTLWYHDPDHLRSALCFGGHAEWKPKYHRP